MTELTFRTNGSKRVIQDPLDRKQQGNGWWQLLVVDKRQGKIIGLEIVDVSRHVDVKQFEPYITYSSPEAIEDAQGAAAAR